MVIGVKVPVELFGQKLGVTRQAGSVNVADFPRKFVKSVKPKV